MEPAWTCTFSIINTTLGRQREEDSRREEKQKKNVGDAGTQDRRWKQKQWKEAEDLGRGISTEMDRNRERRKTETRKTGKEQLRREADRFFPVHTQGGKKAGDKREWQMRREKMCQEEECYMTRDAVGMHAMYPAPWREAECTKRTRRGGGGQRLRCVTNDHVTIFNLDKHTRTGRPDFFFCKLNSGK